MIRLEDIKEDTILRGVDPSQAVRVVRVDRLSDQAISLTYKTEGGQIHETMLFRTDEPSLMVLEEGRPWSFDADGEAYKLAAEAYRINLAYLFDPMMAVHTSTIEPLRYLLADDPGAGKTVGCRVIDVSKENCGWDLTSFRLIPDGLRCGGRKYESS